MPQNQTVRRTIADLLAGLAVSSLAMAQTQRIDIPPGNLLTALETLAKQANVDLVYQDAQVRDLRTSGVSGELSPQEAVRKLLEGTPLRIRTDEVTGAILITTRNDDQAAAEQGVNSLDPRARVEIDEVIVTGTRLRQVASTSPVISYDRQIIENGGFTTVQDLMSRVPKNFNGSTAATGTGSGNFGLTTQIDLRGLGPQSTLILVNGRRVAAGAGNQGRSFDISMIPVAAIARVDILTDGASALYGSDAMGGVVNLVLRRDFSGSETTVQYGVGRQSRDNLLVSQLAGGSWNSGYVLAAAQFERRDPVAFEGAGCSVHQRSGAARRSVQPLRRAGHGGLRLQRDGAYRRRAGKRGLVLQRGSSRRARWRLAVGAGRISVAG